jgi:hypothetical protein
MSVTAVPLLCRPLFSIVVSPQRATVYRYRYRYLSAGPAPLTPRSKTMLAGPAVPRPLNHSFLASRFFDLVRVRFRRPPGGPRRPPGDPRRALGRRSFRGPGQKLKTNICCMARFLGRGIGIGLISIAPAQREPGIGTNTLSVPVAQSQCATSMSGSRHGSSCLTQFATYVQLSWPIRFSGPKWAVPKWLLLAIWANSETS